MATEADTDAADADVAGALEGETVDGTPIPRSFLVEGSGPVTVVRDRGDVTERTEGEVTISHRLETLEAFAEFWSFRNLQNWKRTAVRAVLKEHEDDVHYVIDDGQLEAWDIQVDGHAQAFVGVAETIVEGDVSPRGFDSPERRFHNYLQGMPPGDDVDEMTISLAKDLKQSPLWGPGVRLAELTVKHGNRDDLEGHAEALLEEVSE
jgi:hypothetical protein